MSSKFESLAGKLKGTVFVLCASVQGHLQFQFKISLNLYDLDIEPGNYDSSGVMIHLEFWFFQSFDKSKTTQEFEQIDA